MTDLSSQIQSQDSPQAGGGRTGVVWFWLALAALFLFLGLTYLLRPIMEPDFFWHLKTGEWIWQHGALPGADPFAFTGPQEPNARQLVILQGYWLTQLLYHGAVSTFGLWGVYLLRIALMAAFFGGFIVVFERYRLNRWLGFSLLALFWVFFLENYALERPQVISFMAVCLLAVLYRTVRDLEAEKRPWLTALAAFVLIVVWGNMHGGVLLGQAVVVVIGVVEVILYGLYRDRQRFTRMAVFCVAAGLGSFLSPAQLGLDVVFSLMGVGEQSFGEVQSRSNYEYYSVYTWLVERRNFKLLIPVAISGVSLFAVRDALKNKGFVEVVLLAAFWFFAYRHVRYLMIAMAFSLLFIAWYSHALRLTKVVAAVLVIGVICSLSMWSQNEFKYFSRARKQGLVDPTVMPVGAADYLIAKEAGARIFNTYNWGGYLLWRLAPETKVAVDSRMLNQDVAAEMLNAERGRRNNAGQPLWKELVDRYALDVAVVPLQTRNKASWLNDAMTMDRDWIPVYSDQVSVVFIRKSLLLDNMDHWIKR